MCAELSGQPIGARLSHFTATHTTHTAALSVAFWKDVRCGAVAVEAKRPSPVLLLQHMLTHELHVRTAVVTQHTFLTRHCVTPRQRHVSVLLHRGEEEEEGGGGGRTFDGDFVIVLRRFVSGFGARFDQELRLFAGARRAATAERRGEIQQLISTTPHHNHHSAVASHTPTRLRRNMP
jgi:hypothetical protein